MTDTRTENPVTAQTDFERFALDHKAHKHCTGCGGCLLDRSWYVQHFNPVWCVGCRERIKATSAKSGAPLPWPVEWEL